MSDRSTPVPHPDAAPRSSPPPRGPMLWLGAAAILAAVAAFALGVAGADRIAALVPGEPATDTSAGGQYYTCGMHPWVILPHPGTCPICHMELTPLDPARFKGDLAIDPQVVQTIGVRTAAVTRAPLITTLRTAGVVEHDQSLVRAVTARVTGYAEVIHVAETDQVVEAGDPLLEIYSPQLYTAQQEYLLAYARATAAGEGQDQPLLEAARKRLAFYDISPAQIRAIEERGEPSRTLTLQSPHRGVVLQRDILEGGAVSPGATLYVIADHSRVWVQAAAYESQLASLAVGQEAAITLAAVPDRTWRGRVALVSPHVDPITRQLQVRIEVDNPERTLRPGMYVEVALEQDHGERTIVPRAAVIDTGTRQIVFVSHGRGRFEPREITLGLSGSDGMIEVRNGLAPGEAVVTSAQFLLDSEANMREALARMMTPAPEAEAIPPAPPTTLPGASDHNHDHHHSHDHDSATPPGQNAP